MQLKYRIPGIFSKKNCQKACINIMHTSSRNVFIYKTYRRVNRYVQRFNIFPLSDCGKFWPNIKNEIFVESGNVYEKTFFCFSKKKVVQNIPALNWSNTTSWVWKFNEAIIPVFTLLFFYFLFTKYTKMLQIIYTALIFDGVAPSLFYLGLELSITVTH